VKPKLTAEEIRVLRREVHGKGGLLAAGFITVTAAARQWIGQDDDRVQRERKAGGKFGKLGGQPAHKKGGKK
jgi:hypothetical protein